MSKTLNKFLKESGYISIKLVFLETKHYLIEAKLNDVNGRFILDTGASTSCICTSLENKFKVIANKSKEKASSANSEMKHTKISEGNAIQIGKWNSKTSLLTFDMSHINYALGEKEIKAVDGIIGSDILKKTNALVDYKLKKILLRY